MATIQSEQSEALLTIDVTSNAARVMFCDSLGEGSAKTKYTFMSSSFTGFTDGDFNVTHPSGLLVTFPGSKTKKVEVVSYVVYGLNGVTATTQTNTDTSIELQLLRTIGTGEIDSANVVTNPLVFSADPPVFSCNVYSGPPTTKPMIHSGFADSPAIAFVTVGTINIVRATVGNTPAFATVTTNVLGSEKPPIDMLPEIGGQFTPITLRGEHEMLALTTPTSLPFGFGLSYDIVWTEEDY